VNTTSLDSTVAAAAPAPAPDTASSKASGLGAFIRRHPFASYYGLAIAFPILLFTYLIVLEIVAPNMYGPGVSSYKQFQLSMAQLLQSSPLLAQHRDSVLVYLTMYAMLPLASPFLFFPFAPTTSALIVTALGRGSAAVRALLGAYLPWRGAMGWRAGLRLYGTLLLVLTALVGLPLLHDALFNGGAGLAHMSRTWGLSNLTLFFAGWGAALFLNQGGLLEELGWRGYAWPVLVRQFVNPLLAAVMLGVAWALWHLPREIPGILMGQFHPGEFLQGQAIFIIGCVGMTVLAVAFVNHAGGSVLPSIMIHGTSNFLALGFETSNNGVRSDFSIAPAVIWGAAGLLTWLALGADLGWRRRLELHGGDGRSDPANRWAPPVTGR
jgi:hypothetical protein